MKKLNNSNRLPLNGTPLPWKKDQNQKYLAETTVYFLEVVDSYFKFFEQCFIFNAFYHIIENACLIFYFQQFNEIHF